MTPLLRISVIGLGNLAWSLIANLQRVAQVHQIIGRSHVAEFQAQFGIRHASHSVTDLHPDTNVVFLTLGDQAIPEVVEEIVDVFPPGCMGVHCSGSTPLSALAPLGADIGVLYPLQTFTRNRITSYDHVPLFLEGNEKTLAILQALANQLSQRVHLLDSANRLRLHLGGVMASNFPNLLFRLTEELVSENSELDFQVFEPLIREQLDKVFAVGPKNSQTGPAIRGDQRTIDLHLDLLRNDPKIQALYQQLTDLIQGRGG